MAPRAYNQIDGVNGSTLFKARRSWLHYKDALDNQSGDTPALLLGRATHCAILEPDEFPRRYFVLDEAEVEALAPPRNGKAGKQTWREYLERHPGQPAKVTPEQYRALLVAEKFPGKELLSEEDYARCIGMRKRVERHPIAAPLLDTGRAEVVIEWVEQVPHGLGTVAVKCKGRIDWLRSPQCFVDLKTTRAASAHQFAGQSWGLSTFHKMAFYRRGLATIAGCSRNAIQTWVIGVENTRPFDVYPCEAMPGSDERRGLDGCDEDIDRLLGELVRCRETGRWPGAHEDKPVEMYPPSYAFGGAGDLEILDTDPADAGPLEMEE